MTGLWKIRVYWFMDLVRRTQVQNRGACMLVLSPHRAWARVTRNVAPEKACLLWRPPCAANQLDHLLFWRPQEQTQIIRSDPSHRVVKKASDCPQKCSIEGRCMHCIGKPASEVESGIQRRC